MSKNLLRLVFLSLLSLLVLRCDLPQAPPGSEKASVSLFFKASSGVISDSSITDTAGNVGSVGIVLYLGTFIDSAVLRVTLGTDVVKSYSFKPASKQYDTVYYPVLLTNPGIYDVTVTGFVDKLPDISDKGTIHIVGLASGVNKPVLTVPGPQLAVNGEKLSFGVSATDLDAGQKVTITTLKKPEYSTFSMNTFEWTPSIKDTGKHTVIFVASDNGYPAMSDTDYVVITVSKSLVNRSPKWNQKNVQLTAIPGALFTYPLANNCTDPDNDTLTYALLSGVPITDTIINATYLFSPAITDTGKNIIRIIAKDPLGLTDTLTVELTVSNTAVDTKAPVIRRITPSADSVTVSSSNMPVTVSVKDESGIDTVMCFMGTTMYNVASCADSIYTTTVTGLQSNTWNTISFVAKDAAKNLCTLNVHLKYDFAVSDNVPPVITFQSPSRDTLISTDSFEVKVLCVDDSGVSIVNGFCDTTVIDMKKSVSIPNLWTGMAKGIKASGYSTIKIIATDSSFAKNKDSLSVRIKYDNDKVGPSIVLVEPLKDTVTTNTSSYTVLVNATDPAGVLSVNCIAGSVPYTGLKDTGSLWKINVSSLVANNVTPVIITATDSSLNVNKSMDTVYITCQIINGYSVTFDKNDSAATGTMTRQTINNGESATLTVNSFTKSGWTFDGWATSPTGPVMYKDGTAFTMGAADITLYAKWSANIYNVTFDKNDADATGTMTAQSLSAGSSSLLTANAFVKAGATFTGWALSPSGVVVYADKANFTMGTANVTLYAKWTANSYSITFDKNDAAATGTMASQSVISGAAALLNTNTFTKAGWVFTGWATSTGGAVVYADGSSFTMGVSNVTLYAVWSQNTYTVTFDKNDAAAAGTMTAQSVASGAVAPLKTNSYVKTGSTFDGWALSASGPVAYADGSNFTMGTANIILYATWKVNQYIVSFDSRGGNTVLSQTVIHGDTIIAPGTPIKTGYTFAGWFKDSTYTSAWVFSTEHVSGNMTLFAKWNINNYKLTVSNNSAGGIITAPATSPVTVAHGVATAIVAEVKTGYVFSGWTVTAGTATITNTSAASTTVKLTSGDATVAPVFTQNIYLLTVATGTGGSISAPVSSPVTVKHNAETAIIAAAAEGYTFTGWTVISGTATITNASLLSTTVRLLSGDASVRANFALKTYSLTVEAGTGGSITVPASSPVTVNHGVLTTITAVAAPGYTFAGWTVTTGTATITISSSATTTIRLTSGNATVGATFLAESNELPDLVFTDLTITSIADARVEYSYTIKNIGVSNIESLYNVSIQNFYSANTVFNDADDKAAGGSILGVSTGLAPNATYSGKYYASGAVPSDKPYLTAKIDWGNVISEGNESNNTVFSLVSNENNLPDLVFTDLTITSITDTRVDYSYTIKNVGGSNIESLYNVSIQNFYSANTVFNDVDDKAAGGSILGVYAGLAANAIYSGTFAAYGAVPSDKPYLTAKIDWGDAISEGNESNNTIAKLIQ